MAKLTSKSRRGLLAGGNWIIDQVKIIDVYPQPEQLANIRRQSQGTGGAPYNVLIDLARSGVPFPLFGAGMVGDDDLDAKSWATAANIRSTRATSPRHQGAHLLYGRDDRSRPWPPHVFHARGANALWTGRDLDFQKSTARIFHLGYLLLLDALDQPEAKYGTRAARLLASARKAGLKTSVDVVSEDSDRFAKIVNPALQQVDYCILNEIEAGKTTGFKIRLASGAFDPSALRHARALYSNEASASWW